MSHFTVLVIGDDVKEQLAPYHEFECTGRDDQYVINVDITEEAREGFDSEEREGQSFANYVVDYYGKEIVSGNDEPDLQGDHKYGWTRVDESGNVIEVIRRTNPNKKWDWYQIGGRWSGFFQMKDGATGSLGERSLLDRSADDRAKNRLADSARKGDIDFDAMRNTEGSDAAEAWDKHHQLTGGLSWDSWSDVRARHEGNIDAAREEYNQQPAIVSMMKDADFWNRFMFGGIDNFLSSRDEYIQAARNRAISTYAVLKDGEWHSRGDMGWFGVSRDKMEEGEWLQKFNEMIDALPDDTLLTVVDCHI